MYRNHHQCGNCCRCFKTQERPNNKPCSSKFLMSQKPKLAWLSEQPRAQDLAVQAGSLAASSGFKTCFEFRLCIWEATQLLNFAPSSHN